MAAKTLIMRPNTQVQGEAAKRADALEPLVGRRRYAHNA